MKKFSKIVKTLVPLTVEIVDWRIDEYKEYHEPPAMFDSIEEQDAFYDEFIEPRLSNAETV